MKKSIPFWSWNDELNVKKLNEQIDELSEKGFGGFFMHARSGLKTEYLSEDWFNCVRACAVKARKLGLAPWLYDENGWPSGAAGGKLLSDPQNLENYLTFSFGNSDKHAFVSYDASGDRLIRLSPDAHSENALNVYKHTSISTVDVADDKVIDKFIENTHEVYEKKFGGRLCDFIDGLFTDEPQYYGGATPFPHLISDYFKTTYDADVLDGLGLLFTEKEGYEAFRYKYYLACQTLFIENYSKKVYEWCDCHGLKLTGHYVEEADLSKQMYHCAGVMPFYEYEHIPGIDWLCRRFMSVVPVKQVVSAADQLGKKEILTECFAMSGWDVTPLELKAIAEFQYIFGVNVTCMHLYPYSEARERKNDYPMHFGGTNVWAADVLPAFNDYFDKLGDLILQTRERVDVAVLHPIRSAYITFKHLIVDEYDKSFIKFSDELSERTAFHYVDETLLEKHGCVAGNKLRCGLCEYSDVILPPDILTIGKNTDRLLREYIANGGKIIVSGRRPVYLEGVKTDLSYLKSNATMDEIVKDNLYSLRAAGGKVRHAARISDSLSVIAALNIDGKNTASCELNVKNGFVKEYNPLTGAKTPCENAFTLKPYESRYFVIEPLAETPVKRECRSVKLCGEFDVVRADDNYLVLDKASVSTDGVNFSEKRCIPLIFDSLLRERFAGDVSLKFEFECNFVPEKIRLMCENSDCAELFVNGNKVTFDGVSPMDDAMALADIKKFVKIGRNEIIEIIRFYQKDSVYYALFGENVTEFFRNSLVYDTYIECLRLVGDFGVFEKNGLKQGKLENVFTGENFVIDKPKKKVSDLIFDGYLFFAGKIRLKKTLTLENEKVAVTVCGRVHYAKLWVNGKYAGEYLFNDSLDVSEFAVKGENVIEIELTTGSRNLFGPFHNAIKQESFYVTPSSFALSQEGFKNGEYTEAYSFIRTGLFDYDGMFRLELDE